MIKSLSLMTLCLAAGILLGRTSFDSSAEDRTAPSRPTPSLAPQSASPADIDPVEATRAQSPAPVDTPDSVETSPFDKDESDVEALLEQRRLQTLRDLAPTLPSVETILQTRTYNPAEFDLPELDRRDLAELIALVNEEIIQASIAVDDAQRSQFRNKVEARDFEPLGRVSRFDGQGEEDVLFSRICYPPDLSSAAIVRLRVGESPDLDDAVDRLREAKLSAREQVEEFLARRGR